MHDPGAASVRRMEVLEETELWFRQVMVERRSLSRWKVVHYLLVA
jgi:hypothetical protein